MREGERNIIKGNGRIREGREVGGGNGGEGVASEGEGTGKGRGEEGWDMQGDQSLRHNYVTCSM